jgi:hypothetical protein
LAFNDHRPGALLPPPNSTDPHHPLKLPPKCVTVLSLALSEDEGGSWRRVGVLRGGSAPGLRFHYPWMLQIGCKVREYYHYVLLLVLLLSFFMYSFYFLLLLIYVLFSIYGQSYYYYDLLSVLLFLHVITYYTFLLLLLPVDAADRLQGEGIVSVLLLSLLLFNIIGFISVFYY